MICRTDKERIDALYAINRQLDILWEMQDYETEDYKEISSLLLMLQKAILNETKGTTKE